MTIAVAIRTASAVVFAADSKVTTAGIVGYQEDGAPRWLEQTYDNATKVAQARSANLMAMVAGHGNIGQVTATDFISSESIAPAMTRAQQDELIAELVTRMVALKRAHWENSRVAAAEWPGPTLLLSAPAPEGNVPRVWKVELAGPDQITDEILTDPGIRLEGSYREVFSLLYAFDLDLLAAICAELGVTDQERQLEVFRKVKFLRPIEKLQLWAIPIQDAIELACFLAHVQVEMDRFLPGTPACGGPIDVMVLQMAPSPEINSYPGKKVHHPYAHRVEW